MMGLVCMVYFVLFFFVSPPFFFVLGQLIYMVYALLNLQIQLLYGICE